MGDVGLFPLRPTGYLGRRHILHDKKSLQSKLPLLYLAPTMKTSAILFASSLVATVVGRPAEQATDAELRPRADAWVILYRDKDFKGGHETLTFPHGVCRTLPPPWYFIVTFSNNMC